MSQWDAGNKTLVEYVTEFHDTYGLPVLDTPTLIDKGRARLRLDLIQEELDEFVEAMVIDDLVGMADALGDLLYVVIGAALEYGIPLEKVVEEIHRSNMSKLDAKGKPIYRPDGKVMKGPDFFPPDLGAILYGTDRTTA